MLAIVYMIAATQRTHFMPKKWISTNKHGLSVPSLRKRIGDNPTSCFASSFNKTELDRRKQRVKVIIEKKARGLELAANFCNVSVGAFASLNTKQQKRLLSQRGMNPTEKRRIMRLLRAQHRFSIKTRIRRRVFERDGFHCRFCQKCFEASELTIDHYIPVSEGGSNDIQNLVTACLSCNSKKGSSMPENFKTIDHIRGKNGNNKTL
mmetsp:Transcript_10223/g.19653  ORF Transcript_10223/g.19653 Transcript_10223/m.19653 type:complete len:207 (-) Transcript_10223:244-864(-)